MFICISCVCVYVLFSNGINNVCKLRGQFYFIVSHPYCPFCEFHLNPHFVVIYIYIYVFFMVFVVCVQWYVVAFHVRVCVCVFFLAIFAISHGAEVILWIKQYFPIKTAQYTLNVMQIFGLNFIYIITVT